MPLVYELKRLGVFTPCWSCEGHIDASGGLRRAPGVWFYCDSVVHARLLVEGVEKLNFQKKLNARWQVTITVAEPDNPDTLYKLEPVADDLGPTSLDRLRADVQTIAAHLNSIVLGAASIMADPVT